MVKEFVAAETAGNAKGFGPQGRLPLQDVVTCVAVPCVATRNEVP